jgi:excisionase family DNA binding protein
MNNIFVSVPQASRSLGLGLTKTHELIASGALRTAKIGSRRLVHIDSIEALAEHLMAETANDNTGTEV